MARPIDTAKRERIRLSLLNGLHWSTIAETENCSLRMVQDVKKSLTDSERNTLNSSVKRRVSQDIIKELTHDESNWVVDDAYKISKDDEILLVEIFKFYRNRHPNNKIKVAILLDSVRRKL